jgi:signal transduction histidine kinase/ActR/RegA family two-component response regulator
MREGRPVARIEEFGGAEIKTVSHAFNAFVEARIHAEKELSLARDAAQAANASKSHFLANMSHEIRTPMNGILGMTDLCLQTRMSDEQKSYLEMVHTSAHSLLSVINDILDFSKIEARKLVLDPHPFSLHSLIRQTTRTLSLRASEKELELLWKLDRQVPDQVIGDPLRLQQVLDNLLDNAVKFTDHGHITLRVADAHGFIRFEIEDSGRGIPLERQQDVFKRFEHADVQTKRAFGGTGLGLAICERLVSLQGGRIGVQSLPDHGALFWFELPLKTVQLNLLAAHPSSVTLDKTAVHRFLLVDDNAVNQLVASLVLQKIWPQSNITTASSGAQALHLLDTQAFDLVLMDMVMPGMDGLQTTRLIRQHTRSDIANLPVLGLTANTTPKDRDLCLEAGMNDVLSKPMEPAVVQATITRWAQPIVGKGLSGLYS